MTKAYELDPGPGGPCTLVDVEIFFEELNLVMYDGDACSAGDLYYKIWFNNGYRYQWMGYYDEGDSHSLDFNEYYGDIKLLSLNYDPIWIIEIWDDDTIEDDLIYKAELEVFYGESFAGYYLEADVNCYGGYDPIWETWWQEDDFRTHLSFIYMNPGYKWGNPDIPLVETNILYLDVELTYHTW